MWNFYSLKSPHILLFLEIIRTAAHVVSHKSHLCSSPYWNYYIFGQSQSLEAYETSSWCLAWLFLLAYNQNIDIQHSVIIESINDQAVYTLSVVLENLECIRSIFNTLALYPSYAHQGERRNQKQHHVDHMALLVCAPNTNIIINSAYESIVWFLCCPKVTIEQNHLFNIFKTYYEIWCLHSSYTLLAEVILSLICCEENMIEGFFAVDPFEN